MLPYGAKIISKDSNGNWGWFSADSLSNGYNVKAFNSNIENTIAYVVTRGGGVINIPAGIYRSNVPLDMHSLISLACEDGAILEFSGDTDGLVFNGISNISISKCTITSNNPLSKSAVKLVGSGNNTFDRVRVLANNPAGGVGLWENGYLLIGAQANNWFSGNVQTANHAFKITATSNANNLYGLDITMNYGSGPVFVSDGEGGNSGTTKIFGGIIEGGFSTTLMHIGGSDVVATYGVHFENAGTGSAVVVDGGVWKSFGDYLGTSNPAVVIGNSETTRRVSISNGEGGTVLLGGYSHNIMITGFSCGTTPCVQDNGTDNTNIVMFTDNVGDYPWNQGFVYPSGAPPMSTK